MHGRALLATLLLVGACAPVARSSAPAEVDLAAVTTCRQAFQRWVDGSAALNSPGTEILPAVVAQERVQRRVFELCSLVEAETLNRDILVEYAPGVRERLIEPDVRTFAEIECVDESPLLDGTRLCAEVGH